VPDSVSRTRPGVGQRAIIRQAQDGMYTGLKAVDMVKYGGAWPPSAEQVLPFLHPLVGPRRWSHTEQSRAVELRLEGLSL